MKLLIAADIHGSAYYTRLLCDLFDKEKADKLLLLGDILYHGPRNDLPRDYNPKEVFALLNKRKCNILCVRGNCDSEVDQMVLEFPIMADYIELFLDGITVFATHGHLFESENMPPLASTDIFLHGHTHVRVLEKTHINPGSAALPKDGENSYMLYENKTFTQKNFSGKVLGELQL